MYLHLNSDLGHFDFETTANIMNVHSLTTGEHIYSGEVYMPIFSDDEDVALAAANEFVEDFYGTND